MAPLLFLIHFMTTLAALLLAFDRLGAAQTLDIGNAPELVIQASISKNKGREVIAFEREGEWFYISCSSVSTLCNELKRRPIDKLQVWVTSPSLLAGDWIVRAREGEKTWIAPDEQMLQFARMTKLYNTCLLVFSSAAFILGYLIYGRRTKAP